jgi:hypothetical protein
MIIKNKKQNGEDGGWMAYASEAISDALHSSSPGK